MKNHQDTTAAGSSRAGGKVAHGCKRRYQRDSVKPRADVTDVKNKIVNAFQRSAALEVQQIRVEMDGRKVILSSKVHTWVNRREPAATAWAAPGVTTVEDNLVVAIHRLPKTCTEWLLLMLDDFFAAPLPLVS